MDGHIFYKAADIIDAGRWVQNPTADNPGTCAAIAIQRAVRCASYREYMHVERYLFHFAYFIGGYLFEDIWLWNDTPGRTKEEVTATLRCCGMLTIMRDYTEAERRRNAATEFSTAVETFKEAMSKMIAEVAVAEVAAYEIEKAIVCEMEKDFALDEKAATISKPRPPRHRVVDIGLDYEKHVWWSELTDRPKATA